MLEALLTPGYVAVIGAILSYAGVVLMIAGIPLIFPTGSLAGPRWRRAATLLGSLFDDFFFLDDPIALTDSLLGPVPVIASAIATGTLRLSTWLWVRVARPVRSDSTP